MHLYHILEELAYDSGGFPREAIESAIANHEEITPYLLKILEEALRNIGEVIENDDYQGHLYAIYLLAQFREKRAYPLILQLVSFPGEIPHALTGDVITEDLSRILASVCDTDLLPLQKLIENRQINEYVRAAGISALVTLVGCRLWSRPEAISYFRELFQNKLERHPSFVWDNLILCTTQLHPEELYKEIKEAYAEALVDPFFITLDEVERVLENPKESHLLELFQNSELIEDSVTEMEKWILPNPETLSK